MIGFIDRNSALGRDYLEHQHESIFYRQARFYSAEDVEGLLHQAGFAIQAWGQTLSHPLAEALDIEPLQRGRGRCAFVAVAARKK